MNRKKIFFYLFLIAAAFVFQPTGLIAAQRAELKPIHSSSAILFVSNRDTGNRRTEIYAMDVNGDNAIRITKSKYHHFIVGMDPSRRFIVTSRAERDTAKPKGLGDEDKRSLWILDLASKTEQRLTAPKNHAEGDSFSPDGQWVVFHMKVGDSQESDIYKMRIDGSGLTQLTNTRDAIEGDPSWSHNGREIVFA